MIANETTLNKRPNETEIKSSYIWEMYLWHICYEYVSFCIYNNLKIAWGKIEVIAYCALIQNDLTLLRPLQPTVID